VTCRFQEVVGDEGGQERNALGAVIILLQIFVFCSSVIPHLYTHAGTHFRRVSHCFGCGFSCWGRRSTKGGQKHTTFSTLEGDLDSTLPTLNNCAESSEGSSLTATVHYKAQDGSIRQEYRRKSSVVGSILEAQHSEEVEALQTKQQTVAC